MADKAADAAADEVLVPDWQIQGVGQLVLAVKFEVVTIFEEFDIERLHRLIFRDHVIELA